MQTPNIPLPPFHGPWTEGEQAARDLAVRITEEIVPNNAEEEGNQ